MSPKKKSHPTFTDSRGTFTAIDTSFLNEDWNQVNVVVNNNRFTFRGLHYQTNPPQTKCIKVIDGKILDILVDLKTREVKTFELDNTEFLHIPDNYAHGYLTLSEKAIVTYLVRGDYNPESEHSIVWNTIPQVKTIVESNLQGCQLWISEKDELGK